MATIATLNIDLRANTTKLVKGFKKGGKQVKGFAASLGKAGPAIAAVTAVAAIGVGVVVGLGRAFLSTAAQIDEVAKTAANLGVEFNNLKGFQFVGAIGGVDAAAVSKAFKKMSRSIGEAATGAAEFTQTFEDLGLSVDELLELSPEKAFLKISDAVSHLDNSFAQVNAASEIFGRAGSDLINVMNQGSGAIRGLVEEHKRLRGSLSELDVKQIENFNDKVTRAKAVMGGWKDSAVIMANTGLGRLERGLLRVLGFTEKEIQASQKSLEVNRKSVEMSSKAAAANLERVKAAEKLAEAEKKTTATVKSMTGSLQFQIDAYGKNSAQVDILRATLAGANDEQLTSVELLSKKLQALKDATKETQKLEEIEKRIADTVKSIFDETRTPMEQFQARMEKLTKLFKSGRLSPELFERASKKAEKGFLGTPTPATPAGPPAALTQGSAAALSAINIARRGPLDKLLSEAMEQGRALEGIERNTRRQPQMALANL